MEFQHIFAESKPGPEAVTIQLPLSPPKSPTSSLVCTAVEEQAICCFVKNFVLFPGQGSPRAYLDFTIPALKKEDSLVSMKSPFGSALSAVAMALLANRQHNGDLLPRAGTLYTKALRRVNMALRDPKEALEDHTLAAVIILGHFEAGFSLRT